MITIAIICLVLFVLIVAGLVLYFTCPLMLLQGATRMSGWIHGLRWRIRNGWPLFEGGSHDCPGDPTIVLVHGFGVDKYTMFPLAKVLVHRHEISAPDLPGFGEHRIKDHSKMTMDQFIDQLNTFLVTEDYGKVILVGSSMGGAICTAYAAKHHHRVAGLCLIGPAGLKPPYNTAIYEQLQREENALRIDTLDDFERIFKLNFAKPPYLPRTIKKALARKAAALAEDQEEILRSMGEMLLDGVRPMLGHINCPTTIIFGGNDEIVHPSVAPHWEQGIADVEMNLIPASGHCTMMERPDEVAEAIDRLMERVRKKINRG